MRAVVLVRHGEAEASGADDLRSLTPAGRAASERVAAAARDAGLRVDAVRHSGKRRAAETAAIFAETLGTKLDEGGAADLKPGADPIASAAWIESLHGSVLVVTHLPLVERLASVLLHGSPDAVAIPFRPATLLWLAGDDGQWTLVRSIDPQQLG